MKTYKLRELLQRENYRLDIRRPYPYESDCWIEYEVEAKRKLVRPEGAQWLKIHGDISTHWELVAGGEIVAYAAGGIKGIYGRDIAIPGDTTHEGSKLIVEETLADHNLYGYSWQDEPQWEFARYEVRKHHHRCGDSTNCRLIIHDYVLRIDADRELEAAKGSYDRVELWGIIAEGKAEVLLESENENENQRIL